MGTAFQYPSSASPLIASLEAQPNKIISYLLAHVASIQDWENTCGLPLLLNRNVYTATNVALDQVGKLVGLYRDSTIPNALSDDLFRRNVIAQISANRSSGLFEQLIRIASLVVDNDNVSIVSKNEGTATVRVNCYGDVTTDAVGDIVASFMARAAMAGVRVVTMWSQNSVATTLTLDGTTAQSLDNGHLASDVDNATH